MTDLSSLAERVERLDGPDRQIDGEIKLAFAADLFAAGVSKDDAVKILGGDLYADPRPYTGSIDAAMQLVPEDAGRVGFDYWKPTEQDNDPRRYWAHVSIRGEYNCVRAVTPALALVSAALKDRARVREGV